MWKCKKCGLELPITPVGEVVCSCEAVVTPPNIIERMVNFSGAVINHWGAGMPKCTQEQIDLRLSICVACELYIKKDDGGVCGHKSCGCNLKNSQIFLNKLAWADQQCPLGKWSKVSPSDTNGVQS